MNSQLISLFKSVSKIVLLASIFLAPAIVSAAPPIVLPGSVAPGRIDQDLPQVPRAQAKAVVDLPKAQKPTGISQADKITFKLHKISVTGNTVFSNAQLAPLYQSYYGKTISLAELQKIAHSITVKYRKAGYVLSKAIIPPQRIDKSGNVQLHVVEGYVKNVNVTGKNVSAGLKTLLLAYGDHISASRPLNIKVLERFALLANDLPGVAARTVLSPSKTPGATDLTFVIDRHFLDYYGAYDNRAAQFFGRDEFSYGLTGNGTIFASGATSIRGLFAANMNKLFFVEGSQENNINSNGTRLRFAFDHTTTKPNGTGLLGILGVDGSSDGFTAEVNHPFIRSRSKNLSGRIAFKLLNSDTNILVTVPLYRDKLRTVIAGGRYDFADSFRGINLVGADITQGIAGLGATSNSSPLKSRPTGRVDFTKLNVQASRLQGLGFNQMTRYFSLFIAARAQYSFDPLLSAEEFGFGGSEFGRGYDPSEIVGDQGIEGKVELRANLQPDMPLFKQVQLYGFFDVGKIWNIGSPLVTGQPSSADAYSTGIGARAQFTKHIAGDIQLAKPLNIPVSSVGSKDPRIFLGVSFVS